MLTSVNGYNPIVDIESSYDCSDPDYHCLDISFCGRNTVIVRVHAETPEMKALFAAIHSAINMPALVKPLAELDAEAAEYEETRKVAVCQDCGVSHG